MSNRINNFIHGIANCDTSKNHLMAKAIAVAEEAIISKIYLIRGRKVMLDRDLAVLYGVETRVLNQAVRRNEKRFPDDFMFQLTAEELEDWKSQIVISNQLTSPNTSS